MPWSSASPIEPKPDVFLEDQSEEDEPEIARLAQAESPPMPATPYEPLLSHLPHMEAPPRFKRPMGARVNTMSRIEEALDNEDHSSPENKTVKMAEEPPTQEQSNARDDAPLLQENRPLVSDDDYTRKYPNDDYGAEMRENARIWRTYIDERDIADKDYISDNNATLDGILVFASIFSAIVTTFVTETYQSLLPDPQAASQGLLLELITIQRAATNGSSVNDIPSYESSLPAFKPRPADVWLNSLWFISLILSLLTAFLGVLAKQWLFQYVSVTSGAARDRALVRQARSMGLHDWQVPALIGFLPIIVHLSLALFLVGLIILLRSMLPNVAYFGIAAVGAVYTAYIVSNILPAIYPRCPYRTALTPRIYQLYHSLPSFPRFHSGFDIHQGEEVSPRKLWKYLSKLRGLKLSIVPATSAIKDVSWKAAERRDAFNTRGVLEARALSWLYGSSYNPTAQQIVLEAFAGLDLALDQYEGNWDEDVITHVCDDLKRRCNRLCTATPRRQEDADRKLEIYLRALIQIESLCPTLFSRNTQQQLQLPDSVHAYMTRESSRAGPHLRSLLACGIYDISMPIKPRIPANDIEMTVGMWLKWIQIQPADAYYQREPQLLKTRYLTRLREACYFTNGTYVSDSSSLTASLHNPTPVMCEAMLNHIVPLSNCSQRRPPHAQTLLLFLLETVQNFTERRHSAFGRVDSTGMVLILDCILECLNGKNLVGEVWSLTETTLLVEFIIHVERWKSGFSRTELLIIKVRILLLVEAFCIPRHPGSLSVVILDCLSITALDVSGLLAVELQNALPVTASSVDFRLPPFSHPLLIGFSSWGLDLLSCAFDQRHETTYKSICAEKVFSRYYVQAEYSPSFLERYLGGIPTEKERVLGGHSPPHTYANHLVEYIHQPENLFELCSTLLETSRWQDSTNSFVRLLSLKPSDRPAWTSCLVKLKLLARSWKGSEHPDYLSLLETIFAIQDILNIYANNSGLDPESEAFEALAWDDDELMMLLWDNEILAAHDLSLSGRDEATEVDRWQDRWRNILPFWRVRKEHTVNDV